MIHYQRISEIQEEIREKQDMLRWGFCEDEQQIMDYESDLPELEKELAELQQEQDDYREGYDAGNDFHMGGQSMRDEWRGRSGQFDAGFDQAGQDS